MLVTSATLAMAALLATPAVDVRSSTNCPSSQDIAERLRPLLPDRTAQDSAADVASVDLVATLGADTQLRLRLVRASGAEVGDRQVRVQGDCAEAAATMAAVIAAWESDPLAPPSMPVATATPIATTPTTPSAWQAFIGAGGGIALVGGVAGQGRIEARAGKSSSRLQGRIGIAGETARTVSLYPGNVDWQHTTFEAGVVLRTLNPAWSLSLDAGLALGWATLQGRGFSPGRQQRSFEYGAVAAVRLGRSIGRWWAWAEARTVGWARGQRASVTGDELSSKDLPLVDVTASVGLSAPLFW